MKRGDLVESKNNRYIVAQIEDELELWDYKAWAKGYYDAYIPLSEVDASEFSVIGNVHDNPELLPPECDGYDGEPHIEYVGTIFRNPKFNPEYAEPHPYKHSIGYPNDKICICGKDEHDIIHELEVLKEVKA